MPIIDPWLIEKMREEEIRRDERDRLHAPVYAPIPEREEKEEPQRGVWIIIPGEEDE